MCGTVGSHGPLLTPLEQPEDAGVPVLCRGPRGVCFCASADHADAFEPAPPFESDLFAGSLAAGAHGGLLSLLRVGPRGAAAPPEESRLACTSWLRACGHYRPPAHTRPSRRVCPRLGWAGRPARARADRPAAQPRRACRRPASPRCRPATRCWRGPCSSCSSCSECSASGPDIGWGIFIPFTLYLPYPNPAQMQAGDPPLLALTMQQLLSLLRVFSSGP